MLNNNFHPHPHPHPVLVPQQPTNQAKTPTVKKEHKPTEAPVPYPKNFFNVLNNGSEKKQFDCLI
jgi:hypothetical protein